MADKCFHARQNVFVRHLKNKLMVIIPILALCNACSFVSLKTMIVLKACRTRFTKNVNRIEGLEFNRGRYVKGCLKECIVV
jgi:hypothetical protein